MRESRHRHAQAVPGCGVARRRQRGEPRLSESARLRPSPARLLPVSRLALPLARGRRVRRPAEDVPLQVDIRDTVPSPLRAWFVPL